MNLRWQKAFIKDHFEEDSQTPWAETVYGGANKGFCKIALLVRFAYLRKYKKGFHLVKQRRALEDPLSTQLFAKVHNPDSIDIDLNISTLQYQITVHWS